MKRFTNNETIEVLGASFNGVKEMIEHARKRMPDVYKRQLYGCRFQVERVDEGAYSDDECRGT